MEKRKYTVIYTKANFYIIINTIVACILFFLSEGLLGLFSFKSGSFELFIFFSFIFSSFFSLSSNFGKSSHFSHGGFITLSLLDSGDFFIQSFFLIHFILLFFAQNNNFSLLLGCFLLWLGLFNFFFRIRIGKLDLLFWGFISLFFFTSLLGLFLFSSVNFLLFFFLFRRFFLAVMFLFFRRIIYF